MFTNTACVSLITQRSRGRLSSHSRKFHEFCENRRLIAVLTRVRHSFISSQMNLAETRQSNFLQIHIIPATPKTYKLSLSSKFYQIKSHTFTFFPIYDMLLTHLIPSVYVNVFPTERDKWVLVTTAWRVLRLRMEERPPDMEGSCKYIK